jgi:anti-sigma factor RsiW
MPDNLKDIWNNLPEGVNEETLMRYLQGQLSPEEQHEVEKQMLHSDFDADAVEGLQQIADESKLQAMLYQLQYDLKKRTAKKKAFRDKLRIKEQPVLWISILLLLLLVVISYLIIHRLHQG